MEVITLFILSTILGFTASHYGEILAERFTGQDAPRWIIFLISIILSVAIALILNYTIMPLLPKIDITLETTSGLVQEMLNK